MTAGTRPADARNLALAGWLAALARTAGPIGRAPLVLPLVGGLLLIVQAWTLADILDRAIARGEPLETVLPPIALLAALIGARIILGAVSDLLAVHLGETIKARLRAALVGNLFARPPTWTAARSSGALAGLAVEQTEALEGYFTRYLPAMVQAAILPLAFAIAAFPADWVIGLLFLFTAPLIPLFMALAGWGAEAASRAQAGALARLSGYFADRLRGIVTLKLFGRAEAETRAMHDASEELRRRTMRVMRIAFLSSAVLEFFAALGVAGVALYVGLTFLDLVSLRADPLTLQAGLFCLLMAPEVYQPLRLLAAHYHDRASARAAAAEIAATLGAFPEIAPKRDADAAAVAAPPAQPGGAALRLDRVGVATPAGRAVLSGVSLELDPSSRTAIIGPSGSGKSTLLETIARLRPYSGRIAIDGRDLPDVPEATLRADLAMLGQRPRLFPGTIADNIRLGRPEACDTAVRVAARRASVTAFADALPAGLDTPLGENGFGLSGGEVQRIALARIYLRSPRIVLLDEPTAHLDAATEAAVLDGLIEFSEGRTLVVATHSPAVAARMERAWRIAGGRLISALHRPLPLPRLDERGAA